MKQQATTGEQPAAAAGTGTTGDHILASQALSKRYGQGEDAKLAIADVSFTVDAGVFVTIVGPSGAGKTTLLRCMSGLIAPSGGQVLMEGTPVTEPRDEVAFVFQEYGRSLMPWLTVAANVELPLKAKRLGKGDRRAATAEALRSVSLADVGRRYPWQLSGGMQQRVAIARALAYQPKILLMDEPFGSVDAQTRADLEDLARSLQRQYQTTVVLVTHDIDEAVYLADRVVVLSGSPTRVLRVIDVPLGADRDQIQTKRDRRFGDLRAEVLELIRGG